MRYAFIGFVGATALCLASVHAATAADLPTKAPVYKAAPFATYNWTGFYIGGQAGGGWAASQTTNIEGTPPFPAGFVQNTIKSSGALGGAYAGYNYQINHVVLGIDVDYSRANLTGSAPNIGPTGFTSNVGDRTKWIATATGRLGYAVDNWMFFGKGGWAWSNFSYHGMTFDAAGVFVADFIVDSSSRNGWTVGTGVEWGFASHWSAKLEYDYVKFNTADFRATNTAIPSGIVTTLARTATSSMNLAKLGVAYRF